MNLYLILAGALTLILVIMFFLDNWEDSITEEDFWEFYYSLDDKGKELMESWINEIIEKRRIRDEKRWARIERIGEFMSRHNFSAHGWLWIPTMYFVYTWMMTEEEQELYKRRLIKKYPHLRGAIEDDKWPFN